MSKRKKIILTGGAGLVGQNLVVYLKKQGYNHLIVLDKHQPNLKIVQQLHPNIIAEYVDLAEEGDWEKHFENADTVVMLQAQIGGLVHDTFVRNNITSTRNILAAIKQYSVPYIVHVSSSVVESVANDAYTQTKAVQEKLVLEGGIDYVILRPTLMFGWFDRKHLGWLSRFMQKTPIFPIPGNGRYMRQPLYAGDFAKIITSCIEARTTKKIFNISGVEKVDYIDMIRAIKHSTQAKSILLSIPYPLFYCLLTLWSLLDKNPPFTAAQLKALVAHDEFEVIDWPRIFNVAPTPFKDAINITFNDPLYSKIILEF